MPASVGFIALMGIAVLNGVVLVNLPVAVALVQDGQSTLLRIKIIQVERSHFAGPGTRVVEQVQDRVVAVTLVLFDINRFKNFEHFIGVQIAD